MLKSYKYRIYPTASQKEMINKTLGVCRFIYNLALETKIYAYRSHGKSLSAIDLCYQLPELKRDYPWIAEVDSQAVQASIKKLDGAFRNFFAGSGFPKFKNKISALSFQCPHPNKKIDWKASTLSIPKIFDIPIVLSRKFEGKMKTITIIKTRTDKYFATILVDANVEKIRPQPISTETSIGVDLGIKSFVITSDGRSFQANRKLKDNLKRLRCLQRRASRKKWGSSARKKSSKCVAILHEKIANQRSDYIHKVTTELIRDSQTDTFIIEDLNVVGMRQNRNLAQAISDVSFAEFIRQMQYKCDWYGKNLITIGRFEPSSKMCSDCGELNHELTLADREWACQCGSIHDRDLNAAKNIKKIGLKKYSGKGIPGGPVESSAIVGAVKQEIFATNKSMTICYVTTKSPQP